jgi:hydroxymethylglutaryl-CoA reductase
MEMQTKNLAAAFAGFSKLGRDERLEALVDMGALQPGDIEYLRKGGLKDSSYADNFIENAIGYLEIPLGVATNFRIDGRDYVIPMAVEETSIIAAASKTARWVRDCGAIKTESRGAHIIGQIQCANVANWGRFHSRLSAMKAHFITLSNREPAASLVRRGGGVNDLQIRAVERPDGGTMGVIHILLDPRDAMGANVVNQVCEFLRPHVEECTGEKVTMCILSNLVDTKLTYAEVRLTEIDPDLAQRIEEASLFGEEDPYRAATNNKGVLNGIDAIVVATGNDWRAVEAGVHAYAARDGRYRSITQWRVEGKHLVGKLEAPIVVGTVGGVTKLHPTASMCLRMLGVGSANDLSRIIAAVGLVQNLGALRALTTVGIIEGHMKLHARNLSLGAGASVEEMPLLQQRLEEILRVQKRITHSNAVELLQQMRSAGPVA